MHNNSLRLFLPDGVPLREPEPEPLPDPLPSLPLFRKHQKSSKTCVSKTFSSEIFRTQ